MKKIWYILIVIGAFFLGWIGDYLYHQGLYSSGILRIELFQKELEKDRWIVEQYYKKRRDSIMFSNKSLIIYKQPINGYKVKVAWQQDKEFGEKAYFYFNDTLRFTVEGWADARLKELQYDTLIDYIPKRADEVYLSEKSPFFYSDVDFDGEDEFIVNLYEYGTYGSNLYAVYERDFELRTDEPFIYLQNEQCVFDSINKTITIAGKDTAFTYRVTGGYVKQLDN